MQHYRSIGGSSRTLPLSRNYIALSLAIGLSALVFGLSGAQARLGPSSSGTVDQQVISAPASVQLTLQTPPVIEDPLPETMEPASSSSFGEQGEVTATEELADPSTAMVEPEPHLAVEALSLEIMASEQAKSLSGESSLAAAEEVRTAALGSPQLTLSQPVACDPTHSNLYCVYHVQAGDTLEKIAARFGLGSANLSGSELIMHSNREALLSASDVLLVGEELRIPVQPGILHVVLSQETLASIAAQYGVGVDAIVAVKQNNISNRDTVRLGQEILVPDPGRASRSTSSDRSLSPATATPGSPAAASGSSTRLSWPAPGAVTSAYGPSHPLGIDIALMTGDSVRAAGAGKVTFAGGDACCSYGLMVIIDHGDGLQTVYGHFSQLLVKTGDVVDEAELLGYGGDTGYATGPHLHFEVHLNSFLVNPVTYLP